MIKLEMLSQIAFGQREYVDQLLDGALEDIQEAREVLQNARKMPDKKVFNTLHNLKSTLSMLQASTHVQVCQDFLTQLETQKIKPFYENLDRFLNELEDIKRAILDEKHPTT